MNKKEVAAYVRERVEDFETRLQFTLKRMDEMRCPFWMVDGGRLFDEIVSAIEEWCDDNDVLLENEEWDEIIDEIIWGD